MTVVFGTLEDVGGQLAQGTVTVSSLVTRPAHGSASTVITKERHVLPLRNGEFVSPDLDPGPVLVEATTGGAFESWQVMLPEDGRHDLATLIETHVDYNPSVVGRVEAAAADANRAAQAAGQSATRAGEVEQRILVVESRISQVVADGAEAVRAELQTEIAGVDQARVDALAAQAAAEAAAASAAADARAEVEPLINVAAGHAADAEESARQSQVSADAARVDADRAAGSAAAAKNSADDAADSASSAAASAVEAGDVKVLVDTAAEQAAGSATQAAGFAEAAAGSATSAGSAKTAAEVARDEAVQAAESAQTSAPAEGWPRTSLSADVRDSLTRADTALTSVPRATTSTPGGVQLAGDLGGTWDAPTVPGLASKMDAQPVSDAATSSTLVKRTSEATIKTARPQADDDAATKKYVDNQVATAVPPTVGPSDEEMAALWDAVQSRDMITVDTAGSQAAFLQMEDRLRERGLAKREVVYPTFGVQLTGAGHVKQLFSNWSALVRAPKLDGTSQVTDMSSMFSGCSSLTSVPDLDTSQVTNMTNFALECSSLEALSLDIPAATQIGWVARECPSLESLVLTSCGAVRDIGTSFAYGSTALGSVILDGLGLGFTSKRTLDLSPTKLNAAAANALMESLGTVPAAATGSTLQLPATAAGADTSIAEVKNWTVTIG